MAHVNLICTGVNLTKDSRGEPQVGISHSPQVLANFGLHLLVEVSTASAFIKKEIPKQSIPVMGLLDTGATRTSIDITLAEKLKLIPIGASKSLTAAGLKKTNDYAIDLTFIGTKLQSILNLKVGSCTLNFNLEKSQGNVNDPTNIGLLIGRDIMSLWNLIWHGPTSTVFISD